MVTALQIYALHRVCHEWCAMLIKPAQLQTELLDARSWQKQKERSFLVFSRPVVHIFARICGAYKSSFVGRTKKVFFCPLKMVLPISFLPPSFSSVSPPPVFALWQHPKPLESETERREGIACLLNVSFKAVPTSSLRLLPKQYMKRESSSWRLSRCEKQLTRPDSRVMTARPFSQRALLAVEWALALGLCLAERAPAIQQCTFPKLCFGG